MVCRGLRGSAGASLGHRRRADPSRLPVQKKALGADERRKDERCKTVIPRARDEGVTHRPAKMREAPERLVFPGETCGKTNLTGLRAPAPKAERLPGAAAFGAWNTQTLIAGLTADGVIAPWGLNRPMNGEAFPTCIRTQLAPALRPRTLVLLDTLWVHKSAEAGEALREKRGWFLFLPPYSPHPTPIEMAFAKLKAHPRRIAARPFDHPIAAIADIRDLFTPHECPNYLSAAAHAPT